jgi:isopentenyl-diphosphate delta-isomerase
MDKVTQISARKSDHIRINLEEDVRSCLTTGLEKYHFIHQGLPELNLEDIDLHVDVFNHRLDAPILISSMTGGTQQAGSINQTLATAAQAMNIAMGLGSQRAAIDDPNLAPTFQIRKYAPDILLFANLGAVQLNRGYGIDECRKAVEMVSADALYLHLNPLQEAVQPDGETHFKGLLYKIETVCAKLSVPVIVKEVGWGISEQTAKHLADAGVSAIDVAGAGGTSWSQVEMHRANNDSQRRLAAAFLDWGIPTSDAIVNVRKAVPSMTIFASGGLRTGIDIAKCIALGASIGGMAGPFLKTAVSSEEDTIQNIQEIKREIQVCMFASGVANIQQLQNAPLIKTQ